MVSFNKLTRTLAGIAAAALIVPLAACGGSGNGGTATAEGIPAKGTDDGTEITLWTRSPLERQAKNVVEAYNKSHKNQVKLEIIPNDDMEGKVGGASQTDSLPDILAGDVVRIPYWASEGIFTDITNRSTVWTTRPTCSRATLRPAPWTAPSTPCRSSPMFP